jgi:protein-glutamine gamma-glutamyltransferase
MPIKSFSDAEVLISERGRLERPLVVLAWTGVALFSLAEGSVFFLLAGSVLAGVKLYAASRGHEILIRRSFVIAGVVLATLLVISALLLDRDTSPVVHLGHYAILLQLCKLFERAKNRDYAQVLVLSVVTVATACVLPDPFYGEQLWFAAAVAGYLTLACHTAMVLTLKRGLDAAAGASLPTERGPLPVHKVAWNVRRDWPARPLRRAMAPILLAMFAMGALFFVAVPRRGWLSSLLVQPSKNVTVTGYSTEVQLGDARTITLSAAESLRVRVQVNPQDRRLFNGTLYLRGHVLDRYHQNRWTSVSYAGDLTPIQSGEIAPPGGYLDANDLPVGGLAFPPRGLLRQEVSMNAKLLPTLFGAAPIRLAWARGAGLARGISGQLRLMWRDPAGARQPLDYVLESAWPGTADGSEGQPLSKDAFQWLIDDTVVQPRVRELAREWCRDLLRLRRSQPAQRDEIDEKIAGRLCDRLRGGYSYSLDLSDCDPARDGVEDFLFHMKRGHCEYFASALTLMCRAMGVPARLATGFRADGVAVGGPWTIVHASDAHAWTEVYIPGRGWLVFDATPAGQPAAMPKHWYSFFTDAWVDAQQFWYMRIIRYNEQDRREMWGVAQKWWNWLAAKARRLWQGLEYLLDSGQVDRAVMALAIVLGAVTVAAQTLIVIRVVRRRTRAARNLRKVAGQRWTQVRFIVRLLRFLERRGLAPRSGHTLLEAARQAEETLALGARNAPRLSAGAIEGLVRLYYRFRWGARDLPADEIRAAEETVAALERTFARA